MIAVVQGTSPLKILLISRTLTRTVLGRKIYGATLANLDATPHHWITMPLYLDTCLPRRPSVELVPSFTNRRPPSTPLCALPAALLGHPRCDHLRAPLERGRSPLHPIKRPHCIILTNKSIGSLQPTLYSASCISWINTVSLLALLYPTSHSPRTTARPTTERTPHIFAHLHLA